MKANDIKLTQLNGIQRFIHILKALLLLVIICLVLLYGFSLTTNILTQFNHSSTWLYASIFITCYASIAIVFALLFRTISRHIISAASGLVPVKSL